ncbi:SsgA family sporulation/cell division regulator [Streptomyces sp. R302]|uniref:SsgA family sporulation/cell division regulator n=1 Tax=unclassified Streptomyces TaxID=2593676 RepID=UPI00145CEAAC|nr:MULTISPECIES: SsgA family sporulation/cell division regulator [unclassified Streptomyces]NML54768.1 SsgA family sporulation/cell division regulator [Streptomyces sp. R301]NML80663.1 SsgA family sporulation/cell division regulator [Streptomyces sp. R302]
MDNVTETAYDDFDALLEASSLGSPRVTAAIGTTPSDARRRFDHAARHPQPPTSKAETTPGTADPSPGHLVPALRTIKPDPVPTGPAVLSEMHDLGKAASCFQFIHSAWLPVSTLRDEAVSSPRRPRVTSSLRDLLHAAVRADLCAETESDPWSTREQDDLLDLLAQRSATPAAPGCRMNELHVRTTLRPKTEGFLMAPGLPVFMETCHAAMYQLAAMRGSGEAIGEFGRGIHSTAKTQKFTIVVRESNAAILPLLVTDDAAAARRWADDACTLQDERWLQSRRPPALAMFRWLNEDPYAQLDGHVQPSRLTSRMERVRCALATWAATLSGNSQPNNPFPGGLLSTHHRIAQHHRQDPEHLLHVCRLRAPLTHDLRRRLDDNKHAHTLEFLWAATTELPFTAVELSCTGASEEQSETLWTPPLGRPTPQDVKEKHTGLLASRRKPPRPTSASTGSRTVETETIDGLLHLGTSLETLPVPTRFRYKEADPYAVETVFRQGDTNITWTFARDLLSEGSQAAAGEGDVKVWPNDSARGGARIFIELSPPSGTALVSLPRAFVEDFLDQITSIVPPGTEHTYVSSTLNELERRMNQLAGHPGSGE